MHNARNRTLENKKVVRYRCARKENLSQGIKPTNLTIRERNYSDIIFQTYAGVFVRWRLKTLCKVMQIANLV